MTDAPPPWTKSFDLAFLKEVAKLFRSSFKPHTYGAFGVPNEQAVAEAHAAGGLIWTKAGGERIVGAALIRQLRSRSRHSDFAGRVLKMQAGDIFVRAIAGTPEGMARIMAHIVGELAPAAIYVEGHVESAELRAVLAPHGFVLEMTKVAAASDLKGLWLAELREPRVPRHAPALNRADVPSAKVLAPDWLTEHEHRAVISELEAYGDHWEQHYSNYNKGKSWTAFALKGFDQGDPGFIIKPAEMSKRWKADNPERMKAACGITPAAHHFPLTLALLQRLGVRFQRVRFMRLSGGGGELTRHADITDPEAGTADGDIARLHIPIITDPRVGFRTWGLDGAEQWLHMPERSLSYIDTRKPHSVANPADIERVHLVADAYCNTDLQLLIAKGE